MGKIKVEDLKEIKERMKKESALSKDTYTVKITVHMGTCGIASGAQEVLDTLLSEIEDQKLKDISVKTTGCAGLCSQEPMVTVESGKDMPVKYADLTGEKIKKILMEHVIGKNVVTDYALAIGNERTF